MNKKNLQDKKLINSYRLFINHNAQVFVERPNDLLFCFVAFSLLLLFLMLCYNK